MKKVPLKYVGFISWALLLLGILLILLGCWVKALWLVIVAILELVATVIFLVVFNRCPHCGHFLGHAGGRTFCPFCGENLQK